MPNKHQGRSARKVNISSMNRLQYSRMCVQEPDLGPAAFMSTAVDCLPRNVNA